MSRRFRVILPCGLLALFTFSVSACKRRTFNASGAASTGSFGKPSQVIVQCLAPQGNGGNWASSLGWVAEQWLQRAEVVSESEAKSGYGKDSSWIYLPCVSGGSSGSGVTTLVMSVLQNASLFEDLGQNGAERRKAGFYTPKEVERLGRAVRYVAIGVDLNVSESAEFMGLLLGQWLLSQNTGAGKLLSDAKKMLDDASGHDVKYCLNKYQVEGNPNGVRWWDGQAAEPCDAVVNFGKYAWLAKNVTGEMINTPISTLGYNRDEADKLAKNYGMNVLSDLPTLPDLVPGMLESENLKGLSAYHAESADYAALSKLGQKQSEAINASLDKLLQTTSLFPKDFEGFGFKRKPIEIVKGISVSKDDLAPAVSHPIALNVLGREPDTGFFTITTSVVDSPKRFIGEKAHEAPTFRELRYVVFGNEQTMSLIGRSPLLKAHLEGCATGGPSHPTCFAKQFVLAVVKQTHYMMQPSVREPDLMEELVAPAWMEGAVGAQHMGVTKMRDLASESTDFVDLTRDRAGSNVVFGVTGGWPDRRITAWLQAYLVDALLHGNELRSRTGTLSIAAAGAPITLFNSTFGKPDTKSGDSGLSPLHLKNSIVFPSARSTERSEDKFDTKAVRNYFSTSQSGQALSTQNEPQGDRNVSDYIKFQNAYYSLLGPQELALMLGVGVVHDEVSVNWDFYKLPAMLNFSRDSARSRHLVHLSANAVREGALGQEHFALTKGNNEGGQICNIVSSGVLGRTACSRTILSDRKLRLGKEGLFYWQAVANVRNKSKIVFNARDPRLSGELSPEELESMLAGEKKRK